MKDLRVWLGFGVSAVAVYALLTNLELDKLWTYLTTADPFLVIACAATLPVTMWIKMYRWRLFFPDRQSVSASGLLSALYLGYMANTILPLRVGELIRAYLAGESERVSKSTVLATVLIEKVLDLGTMALGLFALRYVIDLPEAADWAAIVSGAGLAVAVAGLIAMMTLQDHVRRLTSWIERVVPLVGRLHPAALIDSFMLGLAFARNPGLLGLVLVWSVILWGGAVVTMYLGIVAVGISVPLAVVIFALVVSSLGMAVPSAPGYVGVFHAAVVGSLALFGVDENRSLAAAVILHAAIFGSFIVGGLFFVIRQRGIVGRGPDSLGALVRQAQRETP